MFMFFSLDSSLSVLAQARAQEVKKEEGYISSAYNKASSVVEESVKKCKAVASDVANYSKEILGPLADSAYDCVKEVFKRAWSSTGGAVVSAVQNTGNAIGTAAGCVSDASFCKQQVKDSNVGKCFGSPIECARNVATKVKNTASFVTGLLSKIKETFSNLSAEQVRDMLCNLVGSIGAPLLLSIATGGAAAGLLGANIMRVLGFYQKLTTLGPIGTMMKLMNLPFEVIMKLTSPMSDRLIALLKKDISLSPKVKQAVMSCSIN